MKENYLYKTNIMEFYCIHENNIYIYIYIYIYKINHDKDMY